MLGTHLTGLFELALRDPAIHALEHLGVLLGRARCSSLR